MMHGLDPISSMGNWVKKYMSWKMRIILKKKVSIDRLKPYKCSLPDYGAQTTLKVDMYDARDI